MSDLNLNNIFVSDSGRVSFSGLTSGIDFVGAVEAIIGARRIPADSLETRITENQAKIAALKTLRSNLEEVRDAVDVLRGAVSFDNSSNIFESKQAFAFSTRTDSTAATDAASLLGVAVTNRAQAASHRIEILQVAESHKVASDLQGTQISDLSLSGTITINGTDITVSTTDSLLDLRDRINAANDTTGVRASVVQSGPSEFTLALTADETGENISLADSSGTVLQTLGFIDGGGVIQNELQAAKTAQFRADNLIDESRGRFESSAVADADALLSSGTGTLDFLVAGASVSTVAYDSSTDSLQDVADNINSNATLAASGITASVFQDIDGFQLRVNSTTDGFRISDSGTLATDISLTEDLHHSEVVTASGTALGITEDYIFRDETGAAVTGVLGTSTVSISASDTLSDIQAAFDAVSGVDASIESYGGGFRLVVSQTGTGNSLIVDPQGADGLGFDQRTRILERSSNTVSDLFEGVTLSLFNAEVGTTVNIDVEQDLSAAKSAIADLVTAYNQAKVFINTQREFDPNTGAPAETAVLARSTVVGDIDGQLQSLIGQFVSGADKDFSVLSQIGINFVDNATLDDPLNKDTLEIDDTLLDEALISNADEVRDLLAFDFTSSSPDLLLLNFDGQPAYRSAGYSIDVTFSGGAITAATVTGDSAIVPSFSGRNITIDSGGAQGLELLFNGDSSVSGITINFTKGIASELYFGVDDVLDEANGAIAAEIEALEDTNTQHENRIDQLDVRLELQRDALLRQFIAAETALSKFDSTASALDQILGGNGS